MNRLALVLPIAATVFAASAAHAQTTPTARGFSVNHFDPASTGSEWFVLDTLDLRGNLRPALGIVGEWAYRPLVLQSNGSDQVKASIVRDQAFLHLGGSLVLWDRLRVGASLPVMVYADGHSFTAGGTTYAPPTHEAGLGDLRLDADVRLAGKYRDAATLALGATVALPTGLRDSYAGDGNVTVQPHAIVAGDVSVFTYSARLGIELRGISEDYAGSHVGSTLAYGAAAGLRLASGKLVVGPEVFGHSGVTNGSFFTLRATPVEGLLGAHYTAGDFRGGAGVSTGLSEGFGTPVFRGIVSLEWAPQPKAPETDRDHDGILDRDDACPDVAGIATRDPATTGCPPPPPPPAPAPAPVVELDRDHDGVLDKDDACVDVPGLRTSNPATNGCPDPDRDHDGITNEVDACPDEGGPADPDPKKNGCPRAFVKDGRIQILEQVRFETASAKITRGASEAVLQAVADILSAHPEIQKVRVEGHTDNRGNPAANKKLSAARAASVVAWLTAHGIAADRLSSVGFGQERPIADNGTAEGRQENRRVELHIEGG
jgi:OOP family OmpA-OmpF porin